MCDSSRMEPDAFVRDPGLAEVGGQGPTLEAMSRQLFAMNALYEGWDFTGVDVLFYAFVTLYSRFGRFSYGPITIECRVVEEMFERACQPSPGESAAPRAVDPSGGRFYRRLAAELAKRGGRRANELHWLLAFMRTDEGLPARVFGELGISPEAVERFAKGPTAEEAPDSRARQPAEKLYTPEEVADYLGVHVQTVRVWIRSGRLPARKLAGLRALRIRASDLDAVLEAVDPGNSSTPKQNV